MYIKKTTNISHALGLGYTTTYTKMHNNVDFFSTSPFFPQGDSHTKEL